MIDVTWNKLVRRALLLAVMLAVLVPASGVQALLPCPCPGPAQETAAVDEGCCPEDPAAAAPIPPADEPTNPCSDGCDIACCWPVYLRGEPSAALAGAPLPPVRSTSDAAPGDWSSDPTAPPPRASIEPLLVF